MFFAQSIRFGIGIADASLSFTRKENCYRTCLLKISFLNVPRQSQYVFLHQCIMDSLQPPSSQEENVYENDDLIYVNATALRQLR